jgi:hypothetical protein
MNEESAYVFLSSGERCFEHFRPAETGKTVTCVYCKSEEMIKRGTTAEDAQ